jgi:hypothetical protein
MKPITLLIPLALACVEPPSTDKAAGLQSDGTAVPGAPQPEGAGEGAGAGTPPPAADAGPGAVFPDRGADAPEGEPVASHPQDEIEDGVLISGTLVCEGCEGSLIVRIEDAGSHPPQLLTEASFEAPGPFRMKAPRDKMVVLMVIHDTDGSGGPTPGEGIGLWTGGLLNTSTDTSDVELTVGVMPETPPIDPGTGEAE